MSERNGGGYVAVWLVVIISLFTIGFVSFSMMYSIGYQAADNDHQAAYSNHNAADEYRKKCIAEPSAQEAIEFYEKAQKANREQQRAEQDLDAQREMANWAEGMLWATLLIGVATVSATVVGVYWVRKTFEQGILLHKEAQEANAIMRQEQRPWISLENEINCHFFDNGHGAQWISNYQYKNRGRSPATEIRLDWLPLRTEGIFNIKDHLRQWADSLPRREDGGVTILYPEQQTRFLRFRAGGVCRYPEHARHGKYQLIFVRVSYGLSFESDAWGYEAYVFWVQVNEQFPIGPWRHTAKVLASIVK